MKKKSKVIEVEVLHDCPACGTQNLTARGLTAHRKSGRCKNAALVKAEPIQMKEFAAARQHVENIREAGRRASHESILLGHELNRLKLELGVKHGGARASTQSAYLKPWRELIVEQTGLSEDTCDRCMKIAKGAAKSIPILMAPDVLKKPFSELPEARQAEVAKILHKAVDGMSMHQMMLSFGAWKDKGLNHPPKATKKSAANRKANAEDETLSAAQLMEAAKEQRDALHDMHLGEAWKSLDTADLADLDNKLTAYHSAVAEELKARRKAK